MKTLYFKFEDEEEEEPTFKAMAEPSSKRVVVESRQEKEAAKNVVRGVKKKGVVIEEFNE